MQDHVAYPLVKVGEAFVFGLTAVPAGVNLLKYHGELEVTEDHVPVYARKVSPALFGVTVYKLPTGHKAGGARHRRQDLLELLRVVGLDPVGERDRQIEERVADGGHLPVENGAYLGEVFGVQEKVVELVVVVNDGSRWALWNVPGDPLGQRFDLF